MKLRDFFSNDFHTLEDHYIQSLRTRYYRATKDKVLETIQGLANKFGGVLKHIDKERGELYFESIKYTVTFCVVSTSYTETAVDINISTHAILPFGKGKREIEKLYELLDKELTFIGVSLYKGR